MRLFLILIFGPLLTPVHGFAQNWVKDLPGNWERISLGPDTFALHETQKDWLIVANRSPKTINPLALKERRSALTQIEKELGLSSTSKEMRDETGKLGPGDLNFKIVAHTITDSFNETYTATERTSLTETHFISVVVDTVEEVDLKILEKIPADPFAETRAPASTGGAATAAGGETKTEAGICPDCVSSQLEKPVQKFFEELRGTLGAECTREPDGKTANSVKAVMDGVGSCINGLGLGLVEIARGAYTLIATLAKLGFDEKYRDTAKSVVGVAMWQVLRDPGLFVEKSYLMISDAIGNAVKNFKECGWSYRANTVCRVLSEFLLPSGLLIRWLRARLASSKPIKSLTALFKEGIQETDLVKTPKPPPTMANSSKPLSGDSVQNVSSELRHVRAAGESPRTASLIKQQREAQAIARTLVPSDIKSVRNALSLLDKRQKLAASPEPGTKYRAGQVDQVAMPQLLDRLKAGGMNGKLVEKPIDLSEIERRRTKRKLRLQELREQNAPSHLIRGQEKLVNASENEIVHAKYLASRGVPERVVIEIDLDSSPMLQKIRDKHGLKTLHIDPATSNSGEFHPLNNTILLNPGLLFKDSGAIGNGTFFHEVHHLNTYKKLKSGVVGPMYAEIKGIDVGPEHSYTNGFVFDEVPAWRRSLVYQERGLDRAQGLKHARENLRFRAETLEQLSDNALRAVSGARRELKDNGMKNLTIRHSDATHPRSSVTLTWEDKYSGPREFTVYLLELNSKNESEVATILMRELDRMETKLTHYRDLGSNAAKKAYDDNLRHENAKRLFRWLSQEDDLK